MILDDIQKQEIRKQFSQLQTKTDLLNLLNYVKPLAFANNNRTREGNANEFQLKSLLWYSNTTLVVDRYKAFSIPKKNGEARYLHAPTNKLKSLQRCLNALLQCVFDPHEAALGFVQGKNIADNARPHIRKPYVYNLDLKDFFTSIELHRVKACLKLRPFNLTGPREPLAFLIANLCCIRDPTQPDRAFLPQGAPTSPLLTNVVCKRLDLLLTGLARRFGATYTRYVDDLTFSSYTNLYKANSEFCRELDRIIIDQHFKINPTKTRLQRVGFKQEVTGLIVNERVNVSQKYLCEVRQLLHFWKHHGENATQERYWSKLNVKTMTGPNPLLRNVLAGKLLYLKMIRGEDDRLFKRYNTIYKDLIGAFPSNVGKLEFEPELFNLKADSTVDQRATVLMQVIELYKNGEMAQATESLTYYKESGKVTVDKNNSFTRDLEQEIRLLTKEKANSLEVMRLASTFFAIIPTEIIEVNSELDIEYERLHKPKDVANFMKLFDDASGLKYLTHDFDEADKTFNIHNFLIHAKKTFNIYANKYTIPKSLWTIIDEFAFKQNPNWSAGKSIKEGWSSKNWINWSETNGHPSKNRDFDKIIQSFKELTRVKSLTKIIESSIERKFGDKERLFNFTLLGLDKADFYTHVGRFNAALAQIFDEICERPNHRNVTIDYNRQTFGDYRHRILQICHHDSYPLNKTIDEVFEKYRQHGGHLWEVRKNLFGYCDWNIETIWDEKPLRIHLLREGMKPNEVDIEIEELNTISHAGFTHTLTFYFR